MIKEKKTINKIILFIIGLIVLIGLAFLYKYAIYEPKEDWDNISWSVKTNNYSDLKPKWQIQVPKAWKKSKVRCCENNGVSFIGWTNAITKTYLEQKQSILGVAQSMFLRTLNPKDQDQNLVMLNIYHRTSCSKKDPECSEIYNIENIFNRFENDFNYQKEYQKDKIVFKETKTNFINQIPVTVYHDADSIISTSKSAKAVVFSDDNYFEFQLDFDSSADLNQIYNTFNHVIDSFKIIE